MLITLFLLLETPIIRVTTDLNEIIYEENSATQQ
jgi:hypothetical protein